MERDIERSDGSRATHSRNERGDHVVRDNDRTTDRIYGNGHSNKEVREKERDKNPSKD